MEYLCDDLLQMPLPERLEIIEKELLGRTAGNDTVPGGCPADRCRAGFPGIILVLLFLLAAVQPAATYAQAPTISYPTVAQPLTRGYSQSLLTVKLVFNGICSGSVRIAFPASVSYVPGTVTKTGGTAGVTIAESDISNLNRPVFSISGVTAVADEITFTVSRGADCGSMATAKDSVYFLSGTGCSNSSETDGGVNMYNILSPALSVSPPATLMNIVIGATATRTTMVTNGGNGPLDTLRFYIVYPGAGVVNTSGTNAITANGTGFTPYRTGGDTLFYKIFGATLFGGNNILENSETVTIEEPVRVLRCNTAPTVYGAAWGRNDATICGGENASSSITMASGTPNWSATASGYLGFVNMCTPTAYRFTITNTGTGVAGAATMYSLDLQHGLNPHNYTGGIDTSASRFFTLSNVRVGNIAGTYAAAAFSYFDGSAMSINTTQFTSDPDGLGSGLDDLDGDGQFDDLAPGDTVTVTIELLYRDRAICGPQGPAEYLHDLAAPVLNVRYATMCDTARVQHYPNKSPGGFYYFGPDVIANSVEAPANVAGGTAFHADIVLGHSNFNWPSNANLRWHWSFVLPAGISFVPGSVTLDGVSSPYTVKPSATTPVGDTIVIPSPSSSLPGRVGIDLSYTCGTGGSVTIPYYLERLDDSVNACLINKNLICNNFTVNVTGCGGACSSGGPSSRLGEFRRTDNSLGFTDHLLHTRVSAATLSARTLQHAYYLDTVRVSTPMVQTGTFDNLFARLKLDKTAAGEDKLLPLGATAYVYRSGILMSTCALSSWSTAGATPTVTDYVWDLSSCVSALPGGTIVSGDSVLLVAEYYVATTDLPNNPNTLVSGGRSYFFNKDTAGSELSCDAGLVPELYLQRLHIGFEFYGQSINTSGCSSFKGGGFLLRGYSGTPDKMENFRPTVFVDSVVVSIPAGISNPAGLNITGWQSALTGIAAAYTIGNKQTFINPGNWPLCFSRLAGSLAISVDLSPSCEAAESSPASSGVVYTVYTRRYYYSEAVPVSSYPTRNNVPQTVNSGGHAVAYDKPEITVQNNTGAVQGVQSNHYWDVQINSAASSTAPYLWMALEKGAGSGGIIVDSVTLQPSGTLIGPAGTYNGTDKWYQLSTSGLASGTNQQARVFFRYTSCVADSLLFKAGWNCSGYPGPDPSAYPCTASSTYLKLDPLPAEVQLSILRQPGGGSSIPLCTEDSTVIVLNSAQAANLMMPYVTFFPPSGMSLLTPVRIEYPYGSGNYQDASVTPLTGGGYQINLSAHMGIGSGGMSGTANANPAYTPAGGDRQARIALRFTTDCAYTSGTTLRFNTYGNRPCGSAALGNGTALSSNALNISGVSVAGSAGITIDLGSAGSFDCGDTATVNLTTVPTSMPTKTGDTMVYTLPGGLAYAGGFTASTNCSSCEISAQPGPSGTTIVKVKLHPGVAAGSGLACSFGVQPRGEGCGTVNIDAAFKRDIAPLNCGAIPCSSSSAIIARGTSPDIILNKPSLQITNVQVLDTTVWRQANYHANHIKVFYTNNGSQSYSANTDTIEFFCNGSATVPFAKMPITKTVPVGGNDSDEYYIMMPIGSCASGDEVMSRIQTTTAAGTAQCLCEPSGFRMSGVPLPLDFLETGIRAQDCTVQISWRYNDGALEAVNGFEVERSSDGRNYKTISVTGNNVQGHTDVAPGSGNWYYRVKALHPGGRKVYTRTLTVTTERCVSGSVNIYPNPAQSVVHIEVQGPGTQHVFEIIDALGRVVKKGGLKTNTDNTVNLGGLVQGVYLVRVISDELVHIQQIQLSR